jgi:hypothetical protein
MTVYASVIKLDSVHSALELDDVCLIYQDTLDLSGRIKSLILRTGCIVYLDRDLIEIFDMTKTGDSCEHKVCDRCFKRLPSNHFSNNRHKKDNFITKRPSCKNCRKIKDGKSVSKMDRSVWAAKKPKLFEPFTCPICNKTTIVGISKIVLDHNHTTGKVRGYLCESCNTGIGRFDDDTILVRRALDWLLKN